MSYFQYYNEKQDADGEPLFWPGGPAGFPYRGANPPLLKQEEYDRLELVGKFRCHIFRLWEEKDLTEYTKIREKCTNGLWAVVDKDRKWNDDHQNYTVYLEWVEMAYEQRKSKDPLKQQISQGTGRTLPYKDLAGISNEIW